jgi:Na+/H+ antiporter
MDPITLILSLFAVTTALSLGAVYLRMPYPTAMVIAGFLIGMTIYAFPRLEPFRIVLDPHVVFVAILPPLLYFAAWTTSWNNFRKYLRPILLLAVGCVIFTTIGVAACAVWFIPGFTWPLGFLLGAIVAPPDAVAATAVTERLRISKRIVTILDGESLVNDASSLVIFRFALATALGAAFSLSTAIVAFPLVALGGVAIGLVLALILHQIHERIEQPLIETAMTLLTPYIAYISAEACHTSGVLAVVTCGLVLSRHSSHLFSAQTRLTAVALWQFLSFLLNGLVFILIGLQLPTILQSLGMAGERSLYTTHHSFLQSLGYALLICAALIILRLIWVFPGAYLPRLLFPSIRRTEQRPKAREVFLIGWTGMRGVVSLASALAVPELLSDGQHFPCRDLILFITFIVILITLVAQSLTLPLVIKALRIELPDESRCLEIDARRQSLNAALKVLSEIPESHARTALEAAHKHRLEHLQACESEAAEVDEEEVLYRQVIRAQRLVVVKLRDTGQISDELLRKMERELDLEETRIGS